MSPNNLTPHAGEVTSPPAEPDFPQPQPGQESDQPMRGQPGEGDKMPESPESGNVFL